MTRAEPVIWHDIECGGYRQDLPVWREMAARCSGPVLDVGAGTGRVSLDLLGHGHRVVALDRDAGLLEALSERASETLEADDAAGLSTVVADAREFTLAGQRFGLCLVPMQTIQLLGGPAGRLAFLRRAQEHLAPGGTLAIAIAPEFDEFVWEDGDATPLPDIVERDGRIYASQPTAVRVDGDTVALERRREVIDPDGGREVTDDRIDLDLLTAAQLITEATACGLRGAGTRPIAATDEHVGSLVVMFGA